MTEKQDILTHRQGSVCTVTLNNPEKRNALSPACLQELADVFRRLGKDETVRAVILRGAGREAFSAGADIGAMPTREAPQAGRSAGEHAALAAASAAIRDYPYPVIAMLHGYTLGAGCVLAMSCDLRVASDRLKMGIPTARMGLIPTCGGFKRFLMVLGYRTALEIFLTGRRYDGQTALAMGLVNHLVADDTLEPYTFTLAEEITQCAPLALRGAKQILTRLAENEMLSAEERARFDALCEQALNSDDHAEAKAAFKEKRKPVFKGR
jgi:enoyl-CoA hydratase/carnithine racemase